MNKFRTTTCDTTSVTTYACGDWWRDGGSMWDPPPTTTCHMGEL